MSIYIFMILDIYIYIYPPSAETAEHIHILVYTPYSISCSANIPIVLTRDGLRRSAISHTFTTDSVARRQTPRHYVLPPTEHLADCLLSEGECFSFPLRRIPEASVTPITGYQLYSTARLCAQRTWCPFPFFLSALLHISISTLCRLEPLLPSCEEAYK